jgi:hypothetical protein
MRVPGFGWFCPVGLAALGCHNHNGVKLEAGADLSATPERDTVASPDSSPSIPGPDVAADALLGDAKVASTILGRCTGDDDCLPVLDYRAGFICWGPVPASKEDVAADPCLVAWWPNANYSTLPPPSTCVGGVGSIPVTHSCVAATCEVPMCREGKCGLSITASGACPYPKDCATLRSVFVNALAAAQVCFPSQTSSPCRSDMVDTCGCPAAYDGSGAAASAASMAFKAWQDAGCPKDECKTCPAATGPYPTCVADAVGTRGTCRL